MIKKINLIQRNQYFDALVFQKFSRSCTALQEIFTSHGISIDLMQDICFNFHVILSCFCYLHVSITGMSHAFTELLLWVFTRITPCFLQWMVMPLYFFITSVLAHSLVETTPKAILDLYNLHSVCPKYFLIGVPSCRRARKTLCAANSLCCPTCCTTTAWPSTAMPCAAPWTAWHSSSPSTASTSAPPDSRPSWPSSSPRHSSRTIMRWEDGALLFYVSFSPSLALTLRRPLHFPSPSPR